MPADRKLSKDELNVVQAAFFTVAALCLVVARPFMSEGRDEPLNTENLKGISKRVRKGIEEILNQ